MIGMYLVRPGFLVVMVLVLGSCASSRPTVSNRSAADYNGYNEDLSSVRPVYKTPVTSSSATRPVGSGSSLPTSRRSEPRRATGPTEATHVNRRLDAVLDTIAIKNRSVRYAPGYRVQVYVGNQRQEVESIKLLIYQKFPELSAYLSYTQPTYKLKVGDFMRKLDAERYYSSIRQLITSAQLQPDKVDIRRSLLSK
ncbi:MAG: sporulation protein [Spirosoma sp.]|nr:sporulation protein [Spirosoma sp.]